MTDEEAIRYLSPIMVAGDSVFHVSKQRIPSAARRVLEVILDMLFLAGGTGDLKDAFSGPWYLVASDSHGLVVRLVNGEITESESVPDWKADWKKDFKTIVAGQVRYRKLRKLAWST